jgi:hypothetical protein
MENEVTPQETPDNVVGSEDGQSQVTEVTPATPAVDDSAAQRLRELEDKNRDLQLRLTQKGRELAEQRRSQTPPTQEEAILPDAFFTDPVNVTAKVVSRALADYEGRQEQKRQAERYLQEYAEEKGIPVRQLQALAERLQSAQSNPEEYLDVLASIHQAQNTSAEIQRATKSAVDSAARNARAVTTEGGATQVTPPNKPVSEMTVEEHRAYLAKQHGIAPIG